MRRLVCWLRGHRWGEYQLRPPTIAVVVRWLYWQRTCGRCQRSERRWFTIDPPPHLAAVLQRPVPVRTYLTLVGKGKPIASLVPDPASLPKGTPRGVPAP